MRSPPGPEPGQPPSARGRCPVGGRGKAAPLGQQPDPKDRLDRLHRRSWASEDHPEQPREGEGRPAPNLAGPAAAGRLGRGARAGAVQGARLLEGGGPAQNRGAVPWPDGRGRTGGAPPPASRRPADEAETPKYTYPAPHRAGQGESLCDSDRIKILQQQNEDLRRRLTHTTHKMEAMETEFQSSRHFMQAEIGRSKDDLEKMRDKFRRLQNSYTASQRANQDLEEKLHALLRKVERDKKTMDQEIVELTNKLLDAKNTIDKLEELNERYRQDCNLAVQLLKCNKSHFRNHKFADLPYELQDMVNKHMKTSLPDRGAQAQDPDSLSLTPADVVPTSVIARVLEKPEPLVLNSAQSSSSAGRPVAEDVFVHVDMTGPLGEPDQPGRALRGGGRRRGRGRGARARSPPPSRSSTPTPPAAAPPLYPGRKVIEFSSDDKVKIPKTAPCPTAPTPPGRPSPSAWCRTRREAVGGSAPCPTAPPCPRAAGARGLLLLRRAPAGPQPDAADPLSSQSSPFSSPPQAPSAFASSGSSEEDLLANWQRMFVEKMAPASQGTLVSRTSFSSETVKDLEDRAERQGGRGPRDRDRGCTGGLLRRGGVVPAELDGQPGSSLDTDTGSSDLRGRKAQCGGDCSQEESERLLMGLDPLDDGDSCDTAVTVATALEQAGPASPRQPGQPPEGVRGRRVGGKLRGGTGRPAPGLPAIAPRALPGLEDFAEPPPPPRPTPRAPPGPRRAPRGWGCTTCTARTA
ncbi:hypothetical protein ANANG_G00305670 [Anguilla anguilla]|uniref:Tight junction-associated protein 1 domain-containing protein n=1 Tax=Anguilla anguilla TaxID=7936 RepID=A0A9D3LKA6_ANGAN|nr:hypothetical protein ANANG_G00305670 [Anguilla anguilla]